MDEVKFINQRNGAVTLYVNSKFCGTYDSYPEAYEEYISEYAYAN